MQAPVLDACGHNSPDPTSLRENVAEAIVHTLRLKTSSMAGRNTVGLNQQHADVKAAIA